jgi:putative membrane protein
MEICHDATTQGKHMLYLILKSLHLIFIISWFAGLFYLPRIFVNLAMVSVADSAERERLLLMATKLLLFMTPLGGLALCFGLWIWFGFGFEGGWLHVKALTGLLLAGYNAYCFVILRQFRAGRNPHSHVWFRYFNEFPTLLMFATVFVAVFRPFQ